MVSLHTCELFTNFGGGGDDSGGVCGGVTIVDNSVGVFFLGDGTGDGTGDCTRDVSCVTIVDDPVDVSFLGDGTGDVSCVTSCVTIAGDGTGDVSCVTLLVDFSDEFTEFMIIYIYIYIMSTTVVAKSETDIIPDVLNLRKIYKNLLSLAFADAIHDNIISSQKGNNEDNNTLQCTIFNTAMPNEASAKPLCPNPLVPNSGLQIEPRFKVHNNIEISVFQNLGIIQKELTTLHTHTHHDVINSSSGFWSAAGGTLVNNGLSDLSNNCVIKTNNNKVYHIKIVKWNYTGVDSSNTSVCGEILMNNLGMEDYDCVLHDAESVGIFKQFKKGPPSTKTLYYLMLPEFLADSATKKKWKTDKCLFGAKGVQFLFAGKLESIYPSWRNSRRNTFFSDYFCEMKVTDWRNGFIEQTWKKSAGIGVGGQIGDIIKNPNKDNNKTLIAETIKKSKKTDEKALAYQRKRSGDQFQALAIKRLASVNEQFHISTSLGGNELKPGTTYNARHLKPGLMDPSTHNVRKHTYLVTHDLTLCSYALHLGINVLFTHVGSDKIKRIYSFRLISSIDDNNN